MIVPTFTFDEEANGYISEPFEVDEVAEVHIELVSRAPVLTLKQEPDGEYANYGQTPKQSDGYKLRINSKEKITVKLATPVEVAKCYIIN